MKRAFRGETTEKKNARRLLGRCKSGRSSRGGWQSSVRFICDYNLKLAFFANSSPWHKNNCDDSRAVVVKTQPVTIFIDTRSESRRLKLRDTQHVTILHFML